MFSNEIKSYPKKTIWPSISAISRNPVCAAVSVVPLTVSACALSRIILESADRAGCTDPALAAGADLTTSERALPADRASQLQHSLPPEVLPGPPQNGWTVR